MSGLDEQYHSSLEKTRETTRTLAIAGFAIIWLFKRDIGTTPVVSVSFQIPLYLLTATLIVSYVSSLIEENSPMLASRVSL